MRHKLHIILALLIFCPAAIKAAAVRDSLDVDFSNEFLDTVKINSQKTINDYSLLGVNYGVGFLSQYFNPRKSDQAFLFSPNYISVMYTHYSKLFDILPYCGFSIGVAYAHEGYRFEENDDGQIITHVDGATRCIMDVIEVPALAQMHFDYDPIKLMVNAGVYGGYRRSIERSGNLLEPEFTNAFRDYENRIDYGFQGGVGLGIILSPIEIHFNCLVRWAWSSLYEPDYDNPAYHPQSQYYYRYAYPLDIMATVGIHFQLGRRYGRTVSQLKKEAKSIVYGTTPDTAR